MKWAGQANPETQCAYSICDVTNAVKVEASVKNCVAKFGSIDAADANAGFLGPWMKIGESDPAGWWQNWEVNVKGAYHVIRFTLPHLIPLLSIGAQLLMPGPSDYQTSKHPVNRLCEFVQVDHGDNGIKCFATHPGGVSTELGLNMPEDIHEYLVDEPELPASFAV